ENEIPKLSWSPEYGYGYIDLPIRYFKGGPWNSRNSWSNTPNGERGATIPDKYTIVHIIGDKDCLMDYSKFKRWMHRDFWFEDLPPIQIFSLIINLTKTLTVNCEVWVSGSLDMNSKANSKGTGTLVMYTTG